MIIKVSILFLLVSTVGLVIGLQRKSVPTLFALSLFWWLGAFVSAYFAYLAWADRGYSENWAMIGVIYLTLPYAAMTMLLILMELYFTRRWIGRQAKPLRSSLFTLLIFLALQLVVAFVSA